MFVRKVCRSQPMATMLKAHTIKQETGDSKLFYKGGGILECAKNRGEISTVCSSFQISFKHRE